MCRLYGFRSAIDSAVHRSLVDAENAMARQSARHSDGWGIAFYVDRFPQVIRNDTGALNDSLFKELSAVVSTRTLIAHIRQATSGAVRVLNCHPFQHGAWTFAHNGQVCGFADPAVRARLEARIDPRFRRHVLGDTDSERVFYIILSHLARRVDELHHPGQRAPLVLEALRDALAEVRAAAAPDAVDPERPTRANVLLTNGELMIGYRSGVELYFSSHKSRCPERDSCAAFHAVRCERPVEEVLGGRVQHLLVSSEPIAGGTNVWRPLELDEYVCVDGGMGFGRGRLGALG